MSGFRSDLRELASLQKDSRGVSLYSRFVNRPLGRAVAAGAHAVGLSPNGVTVVSAVLTGGAVLTLTVVRPSAASGVLIWLLLWSGFVFDSADGQVARLSGRSTPLGEWFDHMVDTAKMMLVHAGVLVGWYRFTDLGDGWLLVALGFQLVGILTFVGLTTVGLIKQRQGQGRRPGPQPWLRAIALLPADYGILTFVFLLWGSTDVFGGLYLLLLVVNAIILVMLLVRWSYELRRLGEDTRAA